MIDLRDKRILVTGASGFLGQHLMRRLKEMGYSKAKEFAGDLCDRKEAMYTFWHYLPQVVFHLAARVGGISANMEAPADFFGVNMQMGLNLIENCKLHCVEKLVVVGTVCSYPKFCRIPFREADLWSGYPEETNAPYGIAKKSLLVMAQAYRQQYGLNTAYMIPANLYGPGDHFEPERSHVIPALIRKVHEAKQAGAAHIVVGGDGTATRSFLHVDDCARGLIMSAERYDSPEPCNLGSEMVISIGCLAESICTVMDYTGGIKFDTSFPPGQQRRAIDCSRAKEFGFVADKPFGYGLAETIAWYEESCANAQQVLR